MSFQNLLKKSLARLTSPRSFPEMQAALDKAQMSELSTQSNLDALRNENATLKGLLKECVKHFEAATGAPSSQANANTTSRRTTGSKVTPMSGRDRVAALIESQLKNRY
jgi:hypothetical protein